MILMALAGAPASPPPGPVERELTNRFGEWQSWNRILTASEFPKVLPIRINGVPASGVRLQFARSGPSASVPWTIVVYDGAGHVVAMVDSRALAGSSATVWTGRLTGEEFTLEFVGGDQYSEVELRSVLAIPKDAASVAYSVIGAGPGWKPLYPTDNDLTRSAGSKVGILLAGGDVFPNGDTSLPSERRNWCCTGVMVGPDLFLTNWHCGGGIRGQTGFDAEVRGSAMVDLAWEDGPTRRQYGVNALVASNERLDFALLRLTAIAGVSGRAGSAVPARLAPGDPVLGQSLMMVHHAQCLPKRLSSHCTVRGVSRPAWTDGEGAASDMPDIAHDCGSDAGASGAPVFDLSGRLVALHHLGFTSEPQSSERLNRAVKMSAIASKVRSKDTALADELGW